MAAIPAIEAVALRDVMQKVSAEMPGAPAQPLRVGEVVAGKVVLMPDGQRGLSLAGVMIPAKVPGDVPVGEPLKLQVTQSSGDKLVLHVVKNDATLDTKLTAGPPPAGGGADGAAAARGGVAAGATDARGGVLPPAPGTTASAGPGGATASTLAAAASTTSGDVKAADGSLAPSSLAQIANDPATVMPPPYAAIPMPGGAQARMWLDPDSKGAGKETGDGRDRARTMVVRYESPTLGRVDVVLRLETEKLEASVLAQAGHPIAQVRAAVPSLRAALTAATDRTVALSTGGRAVDSVSVNA